MTHQQFINTWNWQRNDNDGFPKGYEYQCTDIVYLYSKEVWGIPDGELFPVVGAVDLLNKKSDYFEVVKNDFSNVEQIPSQGDIIVFAGTSGNAFGHVGIVDSATKDKVTVFEQNAGGGSGQGTGEDVCKLRDHSYRAANGFGQVAGWIKLKNNNMQGEYTSLLIEQGKKGVTYYNGTTDWTGRLQGLINAGDYYTFTKELLDTQVLPTAELPAEAGVVESLQLKDKDIQELKDQLATSKTLIDNQAKTISDLEARPVGITPEELSEMINKVKVEGFNWAKIWEGLGKDQTVQRLGKQAITLLLGVAAIQFPDYQGILFAVAGVWGFGSEVQAYQVNKKSIEKAKNNQ